MRKLTNILPEPFWKKLAIFGAEDEFTPEIFPLFSLFLTRKISDPRA
jgi:hypothetical protein